eukprot:3828018-Prymnesium_polylepis.2
MPSCERRHAQGARRGAPIRDLHSTSIVSQTSLQGCAVLITWLLGRSSHMTLPPNGTCVPSATFFPSGTGQP